ncbi:MAG: hypothetical protein ACYC99_16055 [Candidatus Geothermincolia bacterium]
MRDGLVLLKDTFAYGIKSIRKSTVARVLVLVLFLANAVQPFIFTWLYRFSHSLGIVTMPLEYIVLLAVFGFISLEVRNKNPLPGQTVGQEGTWTEFLPLAWSSIRAGFIVLVLFVGIAIGISAGLGGLLDYLIGTGQTSGFWWTYTPVLFLFTSLVLAPAFVGLTGLMLRGTRKTFKELANGYRLTVRKIWYPFAVHAIPYVCWALICSGVYYLNFQMPIPWLLSFFIRGIMWILGAFVFVWTAACFNKVFVELEALSPSPVNQVSPTRESEPSIARRLSS